MKAISLWQPWSTLMALGSKRNETRSWATSHRGPLAVHAAMKWSVDLLRIAQSEPFVSALKLRTHNRKPWYRHVDRVVPLPFGAIVGIVTVVDCIQITADNYPGGDERAFGDYTAGRYMWQTRDVITLPAPLPCRGAQGIFELLPDDAEKLDAMIAARGAQ